MPVVAPLIQTPPPVQPPGSIAGVGRAIATYWDPSGRAWPMSDQSLGWVVVGDGVAGLGAAAVTLTSDPLPRGGARLRHVQPEPRTISWPIYVEGSTHSEWRTRWRALATAFTRTLRDGPGILDIQQPDGTRRQVRVYYQDGFDGLGQNGTGVWFDEATLTLWCEDPYWYSPIQQLLTREYAVGKDFLAPYPTVSSGQVLGATTIHNPSDVEVWPTVTITGPASLITCTRTDTGDSFVIDPNATSIGHGALVAGETVTVTTDPPSVRGPDGSNWVGALDWPGAVLWGLDPGDNPVTLTVAGAADGTRLVFGFNPRYETA